MHTSVSCCWWNGISQVGIISLMFYHFTFLILRDARNHIILLLVKLSLVLWILLRVALLMLLNNAVIILLYQPFIWKTRKRAIVPMVTFGPNLTLQVIVLLVLWSVTLNSLSPSLMKWYGFDWYSYLVHYHYSFLCWYWSLHWYFENAVDW